jgi:methylated-DNA-protein-cysteine methyltransferase-like protein
MKKSTGLYERVYEIVEKIPKGKVTTYGEIGKKLHITPRVVGFALHANPDGQLVPCHRVVNKEGRVAPGYALAGKGYRKNGCLMKE